MMSCLVADCDRTDLEAHGWCKKHYENWRRTGKPERTTLCNVDARCAIDGCTRDAYVRGWCRTHYSRWQRHGDPLAAVKARSYEGVPCAVSGCGERARSNGWCGRHLQRFLATGDPEGMKVHRYRGAPCVIPGCVRRVKARGLCAVHYTQWWRSRNPDRAAVHDKVGLRRRRARRASASGAHSEEEWRQLVERWAGLCAYCLAAKAVERDHVVPISRGGSDSIDNVLPACVPCNRAKWKRTPSEWLAVLWGEEVSVQPAVA